MKTNLLYKILTLCFTAFVVINLNAQFNYLPDTVDNHQIVEYTQFTLSYNEEHDQAEWVAYELTKDEADMVLERCDCFKKDLNITTGSASSSDYSSTGFDKGHLCPAADNNMSEQANEESFLFSNMSPQLPGFNRKIWADLELWVRERAIIDDTLYVVTGPVFVNNLGKIGANGVTIPGYYYKVILRFDGSSAKTIAFLLPQIGCVGNIKDYIVTVNTIETLTGLDFFPALNNSIENKAESQFASSSWGF